MPRFLRERLLPKMHKLFGREKEHRWQRAEPIAWDSFLAAVDTGDVIMHHGTGKNSLMMQKGMQCYYSHTATLVRQVPQDILQLYGVTEYCPTGIYVWECTASCPEGTRLVPWLQWIDHEAKRNGDGYVLMWRKLHGLGSNRLVDFWDSVRRLRHTPYEKKQAEMFKALGGLNRKDHVESTFCSEFIALAYKQAGLLEPSTVASNVTTTAFSYYYCGDNGVGEHLMDARLDPERNVQVPSAFF